MEFCDSCGTYLRETEGGLWCPKCNKMVKASQNAKQKRVKKPGIGAIYVVDESEERYAKVTRPCPNCENDEAFHWFSRVSGEHAGIRRERTVEHFKCTKCSHTWTESS